MTSNWDKFWLLMWKNALIHGRHPWRTVLEIGLPIVLFLFVIMIPTTDMHRRSHEHTFEPLSVDRLSRGRYFSSDIPESIAYSPQNDLLHEIVSEACSSLGITTLEAFNCSDQMQTALLNHETYLCGIDFGDSLKTITKLPNATTFSLRFPSELRFSSNDWHTSNLAVKFNERNYFPVNDDGGPPSYWKEQFLAVQAAISRTLVSKLAPSLKMPSLFLQRFAAPNDLYNTDLGDILPILLPFLLRLSLTFCFGNVVKYIAVEKEKQLKESLKIMGVPGWIHWASWFVASLLIMIVPVTIISMLLSVYVFVYSNVFLLWCFVLLYCTSVICFAFLMSVFFSKAIHTVMFALLLWFASSYTFAGNDAPFWLQCTSSLLSNTAMKFGMDNIIRLESVQQGLNWGTMVTVTEVNDRYTFLIAALMLAVNAIVYLVLTFYLEQIMPGQFGVARPWYFPLTKEFWTGISVKGGDQLEKLPASRSKYFEEVSPSARAGVQIRQLRKVYDGGKVAVEGLDLDLYHGQITVLLGHNGAGKTTTLSMLTGMFSPTSGTALVDGLDIGTSMTAVRARMGYCPQHNVLFDELTPAEHLEIAARLKGVNRHDTNLLVNDYLNRLGLIEKRYGQSSTLSGGMKRKLSIGMALCGGPKVVLLDEPTTGVDPTARHDLWEFLAAEKRDKTILLSTHFMNEADVLGDRIAIMADGKLAAAGSPFYLKNQFGAGYHLICAKAEGFQRNRMLEVLSKYIPSAVIDSENASEVTVVLKKEFLLYFETMLDDLEQQMEYCGISSFGVSFTTLEEVFLKAGRTTDSLGSDFEDRVEVNLHKSMSEAPGTASLQQSAPRQSSTFDQLKAQLLKKFICTKRTWFQLCLQTFIIPIAMLTLLAFPISLSSNDLLPSLRMSLNVYHDSLSFLSKSNASESLQLEYWGLFRDSHKLVLVDENMDQFILRKFNYSMLEYNTRLLVGANFMNESYTGWFNARFFHSAPLALNLIYNAVLRTACPSCSIDVVNNPLPRVSSDDVDNRSPFSRGLVLLNIVLAVVGIMAYVPSSYVSFYIRERTNRVKLLQIVSGLRAEFYWLTNLLWDFVTIQLCFIVIIVVLIANQLEGFGGIQQIASLMLIFFVFSISILPLIFLLSFWFKSPTFGFVKVLSLFIFIAIAFVLLALVSQYLGREKLRDVMLNGLLLMPLASLGSAVIKFCMIISGKITFSNFFSFSENGILWEFLAMFATCIISSALIWCIEHKIFHRLRSNLRHRFTRINAQKSQPTSDADVLQEKDQVSRLSVSDIGNHPLVFRNLTKTFGSHCAVNELSLSTNTSECFGLLGVNGAGKTTAFRMLTGDEYISLGDAWITGASVRTNVSQAYRHVGYCPQFEGLLEDLTGRETLRIFTLLRGVAASEGTAIAEELGLTDHLSKRVQEYSGGMKRKLSVALALIGNPSVIFLDEPSSGMDPGAKRHLWDIINRLRDAGKTIVLTTHSMDECEALCTRLSIMVSGEFKCLGSIQHLKSKFSGGFLLFIKLIKVQNLEVLVAALKLFMAKRFEDAVLKEEHQTTLSYHIPQSVLSWSAMFAIMEASKESLGIEEYSLGQTTLEQLFLYFSQVDSC